jgi:hypothetical protein
MASKWLSKFELKPGTWVFVPTAKSIELGQAIKKELEARWRPPKYYFHLAEGGHVRALQKHLNNSFFVHLDIKNFFGHVTATRITRCLKPYFGYEKARDYAIESTVPNPLALAAEKGRQKVLPFGFVQSPILASLCLYESALGTRLSALNRSGITVSVYMDDIILSANNTELLTEELRCITAVAMRSRFPLNLKKLEGPSLQITAFNIELSKLSLNITGKRFSEFRANFAATSNDRVKQGIYGYAATINAEQAKILISPL